MALEKFIQPHMPYIEAGEHRHVSMASIRRREQEVDNMVQEWRDEQVIFIEKRTGYVEHDRWTPYDQARIDEVRQELKGMCE